MVMSRHAWVEETPFDPLDDPAYKGLAARIGETIIDELLMSRPVRPLAALPMFQGAGLYMLYYTGEHMPFRAYEALASKNRGDYFTAPIYVGKSERSATRTGAGEPDERGSALHNRLNKHKTSLRQAANLDLADFHCQYLVLEDAFIRLGEHCLIRRYQPLWNSYVSGFGSNAAGGGRHAGQRSLWDTIHPGRNGAEYLQPNEVSPERILIMVERALAGATIMALPEAM